MKYFVSSLFLILLSGCISTEKSAYDSLIRDTENLSETESDSRGIAYFKNISQFDENNFQFVTNQMKKVIKNYSKMKNQLIKIEAKLDKLLSQLTATEASIRNEEEGITEGSPLLEELKELSETDALPEVTEPEAVEETSSRLEENEAQKKALEQIRIKNEKKNRAKDYLFEAKNLFKQKAYENAISQFQKYRDENPRGQHYPEATYYIGQSFKNLKMPIEAKVFFKEIVQSHPQSLWADRAKEKLEE